MKNLFETAAGTVTGRLHLQPLGWKNNQDSHAFAFVHNCLIGIVSDGCGSAAHSEVGSNLITRITMNSLAGILPRYLSLGEKQLLSLDFRRSFPYWEDVESDVISTLRVLAKSMGTDVRKIAEDYFLATLLGFLITPYTTFIFSIGDGYYILNEEVKKIAPAAGNKPAYVGYNLLRSDVCEIDRSDCRILIREAIPTAEVNSVLIGTDGLEDLINAGWKNHPGQQRKVGDVSQFWLQDDYFSNADQVRRKLALVNNEQMVANWEINRLQKVAGHLKDDTTIVVARRSKGKEST